MPSTDWPLDLNYSGHHWLLQLVKIVYGLDPPLIPYVRWEARFPNLKELLLSCDEILCILKKKIKIIEDLESYEAWCWHSLTGVYYRVDDLVFLWLQPYHQASLARRVNQKLSSRYFGPYKILGKLGFVAYELELPLTSKIHCVFHISLRHLVKVLLWMFRLILLQLMMFLKLLATRRRLSLIIGRSLVISCFSRSTKKDSWEEYDLLK